MTRFTISLLAFVILPWGLSSGPQAQADPFDNLDFEASVLTDSIISIAPWTINGGSSDTSLNIACVGAPQCVFVHDGGVGSLVSPPLQGDYSVLLQSGTETDDITTIEQTGDIPAGTNSLLLVADDISASPTFGGLSVSLAGLNLPLIELTTSGNVTSFGAVVPTALAGTTAELRVNVQRDGGNEQNVFVDAFAFSERTVPEPSGLFLALAGIAASWLARCRHERC